MCTHVSNLLLYIIITASLIHTSQTLHTLHTCMTGVYTGRSPIAAVQYGRASGQGIFDIIFCTYFVVNFLDAF